MRVQCVEYSKLKQNSKKSSKLRKLYFYVVNRWAAIKFMPDNLRI